MAHNPSSLIIVDSQVHDGWRLAEELGGHALIRVIQADQDGVAVIAAATQPHPRVDTLIIVAHGTPGQITLGQSTLGLRSLDRYAEALQTWFSPSQAHPQIHLYGCNVAAGDAGAEFLAKLHDLTGAGIAASPRLVGHTELGGDWHLDVSVGQVTPLAPVSAEFAAHYRAVLAATNNFADAQEWTPGNNTGTTVGATHELGEPIHDPNVSGFGQATQEGFNNSVWWKWTAPSTGLITVDTLGSALNNTVLAVYTGGSVNSLNQIAFSDNISGSNLKSQVTFTAVAGTTYYFAVDGVGSATGAVQLNLNTAPQITPNQSFNIEENSPASTVVGTLTANETGLTWTIVSGNPDSDSDGNRAFVINAANGTIAVNDPGDLDFEAFTPTYRLVVRATDAGGLTDEKAITINLLDANDPPLITSLTTSQSSINEGSQLSLSGIFNDPDAGDLHTVTINWGDGTTDVISSDNLAPADASGNRSFTNLRHTYQDNGAYTITVTVADIGGAVATRTTSVAVNNVPPTITQGSSFALTVNEDSPATFTLNATDPGRLDTLAWSILNQPTRGIASVSTSPTGKTQTIAYTPAANFSGSDTFEVQVADNNGGFDTILVNVTVAPQPDPPSGLNISGNVTTLNEGGTFVLSGSFSDPDVGDSFTVTINWGDGSPATVLSNSNVTSLGNGNYTFNASHPYLADSGAGAFSISAIVRDAANLTVSDTLSLPVLNMAPTIVQGPFLGLSTNEDTPLTFTLSATDPADTNFQWSVVAQPPNGTVTSTSNPNGPASQTLVFTPAPNFDQTNSFEVQVSDGNGGVSTINVLVNVEPVNDAPASLTLTPSVTTLNEGSSVTLNGGFVDVDSGDAHTVTIAWGDGNSTTLLAADLGVVGTNYTLPPSTHTYADEGTYTVTVTVADAAGATASRTQSITVNNVAPTITDAGGTPLGTTLTLPTGLEDTPITFSLGAFDPGVNDVLQWSIASGPSQGTVTLLPPLVGQPQEFTYTPNLNGSGGDSFTVRLTDGDGGVDTVVVNLLLNPVNDLPVITANQFTITEGQPLLITQANLNATDVETFNPSLLFQISGLATGERFAVAGGTDNLFTLADVIQGRVTFFDNGDEIPPAFTIAVQDDNGPPGITTVPGNVTFVPVNDAPTVVNNSFTVTEGQITLLTAANLSATDEELVDDGAIQYTITGLAGGVIQVGGTTGTTFTQADVNGGRVTFVHDGTDTVPTLAYTVSDGTLSTPSTAVVTFINVNDPPRIIANNLTLTEGDVLAISLQNIDATDSDNDDNTLIFNVSGLDPAVGSFERRSTSTDPFSPTSTFSRLDIVNGNVRFVHAGNEVAPAYTLTVQDAGLLTDSRAATVNFTTVNDSPFFSRNTLTILEGGTVLLTGSEILTADEETPATGLTYTVSDLTGGRFELVSAPGTAITSFTQADIDNSRVQFVHNGSETAPTYTLTVSDGVNEVESEATITFTNVNDPPVLINNRLAITEGQTRLITTTDINASDVEDNDNGLVFTVGQIAAGVFVPTANFAGGEFQLRNGSGVFVKTGSFTRADIINQLVRFVHNGAETTPAYAIRVNDSGASPNSTFSQANVTFTAVNDLPIVPQNRLIIEEGGAFLFNTDALNPDLVTVDEETLDKTQIVYTVTAIAAGQFEEVSAAGVAITSFTQQQLDDQTIRFVHNGGETPPSYTLSVRDGTGGVVSSLGNVTFTNVNDAPIFTANSFDLIEGGTVVLTTANLNATDVESLDTNLVFTLDAVNGGNFERVTAPGTPIFTFTLEDIILGQIQFTQPAAAEETPPTYTISVTDDDPTNPQTTTQTGTVNFTPINDPPTIVTNTLTISEGGIALFGDGTTATGGVLRAADPETPVGQLVYTVAAVVGGRFELTSAPGTAITTFSQAQVTANQVRFVQDGTSVVPNYTVTVADPQGLTTTGTPTVTFTDVNDAPSITRNLLTITEGQTLVLSSANIQYSDEESGPAAVTYTFTGLAGGQFERVDNPGVAITSFTQAQINAGAIQFVHNGTETAPAYTLTLTDSGAVTDTTPKTATSSATVTFTRVNDLPSITVNALTISEAGAVILGAANLVATDEETPAANLSYGVDAVTHGRFELTTAAGTAITSFTQAQLNAGEVRFVHDPASGEAPPTYILRARDGEGALSEPSSATVTFNRVNDNPVIGVNTLTLTEGATVTLSATNLSATDEEDAAGILTYSVEGTVTAGKFVLASDPTQTAITSFTQAQVNEGAIQFIHNGTETAPAYTLRVTDSEAGFSTLPATVTFTRVNDLPSIPVNVLTITEAGAVILNSGTTHLTATDEETPAADLTFTVSAVTHGQFELVSAPGSAITSFTQAQVAAGAVRFVHNPASGETPPTYTLTATDGEGGVSEPSPATVTFNRTNDAPVITVNALTLTEGATVTLSATNLSATDEEDAAGTLTYSVEGSVTGGKFVLASDPTLAPITSFTQAQVNAGAIQFVQDGTETIPAYTLRVTDSEAAFTTLAATVTFTPVNDAPIFQTNALTINEGQAVTLGNGNLFASDEESLPTALTYTVQSVTNGRFALATAPATAITSFTQAQVTAGAVQFIHNGDEVAPTYSLVVTDGNGATATLPATIAFTHLNDAPTFLANRLRVAEGATVTLTLDDINATDPDNDPNSLAYSVANVVGGEFRLNGTALATGDTFSRIDISLGRITFVDDGDAAPPSFEFVATDPVGDSTTVPATITFTPVNDAPRLNVNNFPIVEGDILVLTASNLSATDEETPSEQLRYQVRNLVGGFFTNINGDEIFSFSQADINAGNRIVFSHDGSETVPAFTLEVTDPQGGSTGVIPAVVNYTPVNDAPVFVRNLLTIAEGQTVVLSTANIEATDVDTPASQLIFGISSLANGVFTASGTVLGVGDTFSRNQLVLGEVSFTASDTGAVPAYNLVVFDQDPTDPKSAARPGTITFTPVNDAPQITANAFTITEGQNLQLSAANLNGSDEESTNPAQLTYTVAAVAGGTFFSVSAGNVTTFTQKDVNDGLIFFRHNGSETPAAFSLTLRDPNGGTATAPGNVTYIPVNDPPVLTVNAFGITEAGTLKLSALNLTATDPDNTATQLTYTIAGLAGGQFGRDANLDGSPDTLGITTFTQAEINDGLIFFLDDGDEAPPSFTVAVSDGPITLPAVAANVTFTKVNDPPSNVVLNLSAPAINEGSSIVFSGTFVDPDSTTHTAVINWGNGTTTNVPSSQIINNGGGNFSLPTINRTYADDGEFVITVTINDGTATAQQTIPLTVNDVPPVVALSGSGPIKADTLYTLTIGTPVDPGADSYVSFLVDWGDGTTTTVSNPGDVNKVYKVLGDYTISVSTTDNNGQVFNVGTQTANILYPITDFTGDGNVNLLWRFTTDVTNALWFLDDSGNFGDGLLVRPLDRAYEVQTIADFNNDGRSDIFWRQASTGENAIWLMDGTSVVGSQLLPSVDQFWDPVAFTDFNNDGNQDVLWRHAFSGESAIWLLANGQLLQGLALPTLDVNFEVAAISDFNQDGFDDILWRNASTTQNLVWSMNGAAFTGQSTNLTPVDSSWNIVAVADFNGDKIEDVVWRHASAPLTALWEMAPNGVVANGLLLPDLDQTYVLRGATDFNGDNQTDILWRNSTTGDTFIWAMNGTTVTGTIDLPDPGAGWQVFV